MNNVSQSGLAPAPVRHLIGIVGNTAHQGHSGLFKFPGYELAIVEFDDQGVCYDRAQMHVVADRLATLEQSDAIVVVFVHGWKHDARSDDANLASFQGVLAQTAAAEKVAASSDGYAPRPLIGVFVGWRGMSLYDRYGVIDNVTFWNRQSAGRRVSVGSVRELFGRFRQYRKIRQNAGGSPLFVIVGHSFGGMIVFSAVAQALVESALRIGDQSDPSFADLVLLVNPAIEAARYLPVQALIDEYIPAGPARPPIFVCATAENDWATKIAFPVGNAISLSPLTEKARGSHERQAILKTIGHAEWLKTHGLTAPGGGPFQLSPVAGKPGAQSPFWVVQASPDVIDGHNGIFQAPFLRFVAKLVLKHVAFSATRPMRVRSAAHAHHARPDHDWNDWRDDGSDLPMPPPAP